MRGSTLSHLILARIMWIGIFTFPLNPQLNYFTDDKMNSSEVLQFTQGCKASYCQVQRLGLEFVWCWSPFSFLHFRPNYSLSQEVFKQRLVAYLEIRRDSYSMVQNQMTFKLFAVNNLIGLWNKCHVLDPQFKIVYFSN